MNERKCAAIKEILNVLANFLCAKMSNLVDNVNYSYNIF